ncbi:MAG: phospho-N-acetylmuramoyl-pentapeptide-transferase [Oscillospiraceae bacterium]|jgi:phospho-N-acetylmuramoyl-pentapeptide-transferase|nr:phospho-N-acetylmuramoyl-pentapeptide-transferase [Oscillospiraceae bacterium]
MKNYIIIFAVSLAAAVVTGFFLIPYLSRRKFVQHIQEDMPVSHGHKEGTPSFGGFIFIAGAVAGFIALFVIDVSRGHTTYLSIFALSAVFGAIGFLDDLTKVKKGRNLGLTASQKFILQLAAAVAYIMLMRAMGKLSPNLYVPFFRVTIPISEPVYLVFAAIVIVAEVNAVNLTDGADGLCAGVTLPVTLCFTAITIIWGTIYAGIGLYAAAISGGIIGFLFYNFHPAKVFMGDTGAMFLGGSVVGIAFALDIPLILLPLGLIYFLEVMSDVIFIGYYKLTHGKKIFRGAPMHHALQRSGWSEYKLFFIFTGVSAVCAVVSFIISAPLYMNM